MNNEILMQAKEVLKQQKFKETCLKANICACCGSSLQEPKRTIKKFLWFTYSVSTQTDPLCPYYYKECYNCGEVYMKWG